MQKFSGKVAKLFDVMNGFGTVDCVMTEEAFVNAMNSIKSKWIPLKTETSDGSKVIGFFNEFWIEEVDGEKYVFGSGFVYDEYTDVPALKNFSLEILDQRGKDNKEILPVGININ